MIRNAWWLAALLLVGCFRGDSDLTWVEAKGFGERGGYSSLPAYAATWRGSYLAGGDAATGRLVSAPFVAPAVLMIDVAGYPSKPGNRVYLQSFDKPSDHHSLALPDAAETWRNVRVAIPEGWQRRRVTLVAVDERTEMQGWLAIGAVRLEAALTPTSLLFAMLRTLIALAVILLLGAPWAVWLGGAERTPSDHLAASFILGLVGASLLVAVGLLCRLSDRGFFVLLWLAIVAGGQFVLRRFARAWPTWRDDPHLRFALASWLLFALASFAIIATPNTSNLELGRQMTMGGGLPSDCFLPYRVREMVVHRLDPEQIAFMGDWRLSDRGPLLGLAYAAIDLAEISSAYPDFVAFGALANAFCLFALLGLLQGQDMRRIAAAMLFLAFNYCLRTNVWFTWPKLLATGIALFAIRLAFQRKRPWLAGIAFSAAVSSHGFILFSAPVLAVAWLLAEGRRTWRWPGFAMMGYIAAGVPWGIYTRFWHPDRRRLLYWNLFDYKAPTTAPFSEIAAEYFATHPWPAIMAAKLRNLRLPYDWGELRASAIAVWHHDWNAALDFWHRASFYRLIGAVGVLLIGLTATTLRQRITRLEVVFASCVILPYLGFVIVNGQTDSTFNHVWAYPSIIAWITVATTRASIWPRALAALFVIYASIELAIAARIHPTWIVYCDEWFMGAAASLTLAILGLRRLLSPARA